MPLQIRLLGATLSSLFTLVAFAAPLAAQTADPPAPTKPAAQPTTPTPVTDASAPASPPKPPPIVVDSQLLTPIPAPAKILTSWRDAVHLVETRTPDVRIAEEEVARAAAISRQELGRILPTLNASTSFNTHLIRGDVEINNPFFAYTVFRGDLSLTVPIQPRAWYAAGTARQSVETAKLSAADRRRVLLGSAASSIVAVVTAERTVEINRTGLRTALERLELTQRRLRLGTATRLDVVRAEQDVALTSNVLVQSNESLRRAREALGLALGEDEPYGVVPTISLNDIENSVRAQCVIGKPEDRADVQAAQNQLEVNQRQVTEAQLTFLPSAQLSSTFALSSQKQFNDKNYTWTVGALISIPIFEGSRYGTVAATRAVVEQQRARVDATARQARLEVTQATRAVEVAEQARVIAESTRDLAKETARLSQVAYEAGTVTSFELIDAARRLRETENDLVVREFELLRAKVAALLAAAVCDG